MGFLIGLVLGLSIAIFATVGAANERLDNILEKTCKGTGWVVEEPLIKKTLTCVVELKEEK